MKRIMSGIVLVFVALSAPTVHAGPLDVGATMFGVADGANFDYTIQLTNLSSSTDHIQTFWYAWLPTPADFLPTSPITVTNPTDWTSIITHFPNINQNGYAIQYKTSTAGLAPGDSLLFKFTSADTPAQLAGNSPFFPDTPVGTSFVYSGQPFLGDALEFQVLSVPEPGSLTLALIGVAGVLGAARLRRAHVAG